MSEIKRSKPTKVSSDMSSRDWRKPITKDLCIRAASRMEAALMEISTMTTEEATRSAAKKAKKALQFSGRILGVGTKEKK